MKLKAGDSLWIAMYDGSVHKLASPKDSGVTEDELRGLFEPADLTIVELGDFTTDSRANLFPEIRRPGRRAFGRDAKKVDFAKEAPKAPRIHRDRAVKEKKDDKKFE